MKQKPIVLLILILSASLQLQAHSQQEADSVYQTKNYVKAAAMYEEMLKKEQSAELYYNLAGAYFRMENLPKAILNYERAYRLAPADEDIRFNLEVCRNRITDHFGSKREMFFTTFARDITASRSYRQWGAYALCFFALTLLLTGIYAFGQRVWLRKTGFFAACATLLLTIVCNITMWIQYRDFHHVQKGVVFKATQVYASPTENSKKVMELHEGTTVILMEDGIEKGWQQVEMPDGTKGWIPPTNIEKV